MASWSPGEERGREKERRRGESWYGGDEQVGGVRGRRDQTLRNVHDLLAILAGIAMGGLPECRSLS